MKCEWCKCSGYPGPELRPGECPIASAEFYADILKDDDILLFSYSSVFYCYPCHCKVTKTCFQCGDVVDALIRDERCKNDPYVCGVCVKNKHINHLWECSEDGCYTIEEMAQDEYEWLQMEKE